MRFVVGEVVETKKNHTCGNNEWTVIRVGVDIKLKCKKCDREILVFKPDLEKKIKNHKCETQ